MIQAYGWVIKPTSLHVLRYSSINVSTGCSTTSTGCRVIVKLVVTPSKRCHEGKGLQLDLRYAAPYIRYCDCVSFFFIFTAKHHLNKDYKLCKIIKEALATFLLVWPTVKHLFFVWPYFCETTILNKLHSRDFTFANCPPLFYNPYMINYWRGLYFNVSMVSWIYTKIKSSRIKGVLQ